jgi:hypothetical protein
VHRGLPVPDHFFLFTFTNSTPLSH